MEYFDIVIIGAGTAGLTAGIYSARAKRRTLILDRKKPGGQTASTERLENYPGFPGGINGRTLMDLFRDQAVELGARLEKEKVLFIEESGTDYRIKTANNAYLTRAVIVAPGCEPRKLGIPGENELIGKGISFCATCDAELYEEASVVVVGSGDTAIEEANYISRFADEVKIVVVHDKGVLDCNKSMADEAFKNPKLKWLWNRMILSVEGDEIVQGVKLKDLQKGDEEYIECDGVFFFVGTIPQTDFLSGFIETKNGFIVTDDKMETSRNLVFGAGDARIKKLRQVVTAASDGAIASFYADKAITELDEYNKYVKKAGNEYLLYFYFPPVQKSLDMFPFVEEKSKKYKLPLIKLDISRYGNIAAKYKIKNVPYFLIVKEGREKEKNEV